LLWSLPLGLVLLATTGGSRFISAKLSIRLRPGPLRLQPGRFADSPGRHLGFMPYRRFLQRYPDALRRIPGDAPSGRGQGLGGFGMGLDPAPKQADLFLRQSPTFTKGRCAGARRLMPKAQNEAGALVYLGFSNSIGMHVTAFKPGDYSGPGKRWPPHQNWGCFFRLCRPSRRYGAVAAINIQ